MSVQTYYFIRFDGSVIMWIQSGYFMCSGRERNNVGPARLNSSTPELRNRKKYKWYRRGMEND
jgi:hypothetical protein